MKSTHLLLAVVMLASSATALPAQSPYPRTPSKLNWVARFWGLGWSAGYHARTQAGPAMYGVYGPEPIWAPIENVPPPAAAPQPPPTPSDPAYLSIPRPAPPRDAAGPALNHGAFHGLHAPQERAAADGGRVP